MTKVDDLISKARLVLGDEVTITAAGVLGLQDNYAAIQNRNGQKIEDAQVETDDGHEADNRLPARLLDGEPSFPGNPNRSTEVLHRKAARDHAVQHLQDQPGIAQVEMNRLVYGRW